MNRELRFIPTHVVLKIKRDKDGLQDRLKACVVAEGISK